MLTDDIFTTSPVVVGCDFLQLQTLPADAPGALPCNVNGTRTNHTCELCGFEPKTKNKYRERQDHLVMKHFKERIDRIFPIARPYTCPQPDCFFTGKDRQALLRHYTGKHGILEMYLRDELASMGIDYPINENGRRRHANSKLFHRDPNRRPAKKLRRSVSSSASSEVSSVASPGSSVDSGVVLSGSAIPEGVQLITLPGIPSSLQQPFPPASVLASAAVASARPATSTTEDLRLEVQLIMASLKPIEREKLFPQQAQRFEIASGCTLDETLLRLQPVEVVRKHETVAELPVSPLNQPLPDILAQLPREPIKLPSLAASPSECATMLQKLPSMDLVTPSKSVPTLNLISCDLLTPPSTAAATASTSPTLLEQNMSQQYVSEQLNSSASGSTMLAFIEDEDATLRPTSLDSLMVTSSDGMPGQIVLQDATTQHLYVQTSAESDVQQTLSDALGLIQPPSSKEPEASLTNDNISVSNDSGISSSVSPALLSSLKTSATAPLSVAPMLQPDPNFQQTPVSATTAAVVVVNDLPTTSGLDENSFVFTSNGGPITLYSSLESTIA